MGNIGKQITALFFVTSILYACNVADIPGMFVSDESVNQRFEQSMEWNLSHPYREIEVATDYYNLLFMGDSHLGGTENLDDFFGVANQEGSSAVIMVGDLTSGHKEHFQILEDKINQQDSLNAFLCAGNHDLYFDGWKEYYASFGASTYLFTIQTPTAKDLYISLDTGGGTLGSQQLDWLKIILREMRPEHRRCIIFTHNNLFRFRHTSSTNPNMEEIYVLLELFTKHHVDMVVTGHDHKKYEQPFGNTIHLTLDALKDGLSNSGYMQLHLSGGELDYHFLNF